jgi:hypothetical protein
VVVCGRKLYFALGVVVCCCVCGCLQKGVVIYGSELLSANGSGCLWQGVVVCGGEWLSAVGSYGL